MTTQPMGFGVRPLEGKVQVQTLALPSMSQVSAVMLTPTMAVQFANNIIKVAQQVAMEARKTK